MMNKHRLSIVLAVLVALVFTLSLMAGCGGGGDTATTPQEPAEKTAPQEPVPPGMDKVLVVVADSDVNETECNAVLQVLGGGHDLVIANASGEDAVGDRGGVYPVDIAIADADTGDYETVVLVGGMGMTEYFEDPTVLGIVQEMDAAGKTVAAICIAPVILANAGILEGVEATVSPGRRDALAAAGAVVVDEPVVVDGNIITGWGPDASDEFAQAVNNALSE